MPHTVNLYLASATPAFERRLSEAAGSVMPEEKRARIERCRVAQQRTCMLLGEVLLAWALFEGRGIVLRAQAREQGEHGKPGVRLAQGRVEFNISHSGIWVLLGVDDNPIGVDIQQHGPCDERLVDKVMSPAEAVRWREAPDQAEAFHDVWVQRESELKWRGIGIAGLGRRDLAMPEHVRVCKVAVPQGYSGSVCGVVSGRGCESMVAQEVALESLLRFSHGGAAGGVEVHGGAAGGVEVHGGAMEMMGCGVDERNTKERL